MQTLAVGCFLLLSSFIISGVSHDVLPRRRTWWTRYRPRRGIVKAILLVAGACTIVAGLSQIATP